MMSGEVGDVLSSENVVTDAVSTLDSEDLLSIEADVATLSATTVNEAPNEQAEESLKQSDVVVEVGVKLDEELAGSDSKGGEVKVDVNREKNVETSLATEEPLGQGVLIDAQVDTVFEPAIGIVSEVGDTEVAVTGKEQSFDHHVIDNLVGSSLRSCSSNVNKQSSSYVSGLEVADVIDTPSQVEAVVVTDDMVTEETTSLTEPTVQKGGDDVTPAHEMNKETPVEGNKPEELLALPDVDISTVGEEPVSSAPCTEDSVKEAQHSVVELSGSNLNSTKASYLVMNEENKHPQDPQVPCISKKDDTFSFNLPKASDGDTDKVSQPFITSQDLAASGTVVGSPVAFSSTPKKKKSSTKISEVAKESSEPKRRRSTPRKGGKKGNQPDDASILKQLDRGEGPATSLTPIGSSLPTLNFSMLQPAAFHQPFSDMQQLQLRAQIFVYGSLIQGIAPDEACLISAFGGPDGGRSIWEKPWRKWVERIHYQISQTNMNNPVLQSSGKAKRDQTNKRKRNAPLIGSAGSSDSPHAVNPIIPLSSPFWSMHNSPLDGLQVGEISQAPLADHNFPPLPPFQSVVENTGHVSSPWSSHASRPLPWVSSAQTSPWNPNMLLSAYPSAEPVKLIPVKESSLIPYSTANHVAPNLSVPSIAPPAISSEMVGDIKVLNSLRQIAKEPKAKKPKKISVSKNASQLLESASHSSVPLLVDPGNSILIASSKPSPLPAAVALTTSTTPLCSSDHISVEDKDAGKNNFTSEDNLQRVNEAKSHAEEAAACAEAAVTHSQYVWDQFDKKKNSGLTADLESKVASAAAAIAAAVSVAKAAAAAARLASEAALQAKVIADESLISSECIKFGSANGVAFSGGLNLLDKVTPASILKGESSANISTSIIGAAKEAARRRIESAMSASMHAKNLDAIVKAAELAAGAVAQAGRVAAMGDSLPLSELVHSGPEGSRKLSQQPPEQIAVSNSAKEISFNNKANDGKFSIPEMAQDGSLIPQPSYYTKAESQPAPERVSPKRIDAQTEDLVSDSIANEDLNVNAEVPPELVCEKKSPLTFCQESGNIAETLKDNLIKEGSVVEVFKEWGTVKAAWFSAKVLELKDDEVCVSYIEKKIGNGEYKEWITLSCEDNTAPIVRIAHPLTVVPSDGARKRRRSAIGRSSWEAGDKVDAWMQDCWWEGLIIEKNGKDALSLTVQFPAQGETCVVKAWNLRPSLIWKDGAWVQWSNPSENVLARPEDATPRGKRQRLNSSQKDVKGKDKASESHHDQSSLMDLSENDKIFNVGRSTRDDDKVNAQLMVRTGLREGSKVIFGVPKPGKKRKFMDVGNSNEPRKTSRIPISRGPHGWKTSIPKTEAQQKISKSKPKDPSVTVPSEVDEGRELDHTADNDSVSGGPERQAEPESCSVADEATDDSILISSLARPPTNPSSKKSALGNLKSERTNRGKLGVTHVHKADAKDNKVFSRTTQQEASDAAEPRRSNRRIQPTSRLLEGLQSSLSIAKVPSTANKK